MAKNNLQDVAAERAALSILCQSGSEYYFDVNDILTEETFTVDSNIVLYKCVKQIFQDSTSNKIDIGTILSAAATIGLTNFFDNKTEMQHIKAIMDFPADKSNLKSFVSKLKKLEIARKLLLTTQKIQKDIKEVNGTESITNIISIAEDPIINFATSLDDSDNKPELMSVGLDDYIKQLEENPIDQVGISTGFSAYDYAIGGGLRKSTINVIAARPKTGKTLLSDNMGFHIASKLKIPVLNMDTEMTKADHINRLLAMCTEIDISKIETGKFAASPNLKNKIVSGMQEMKEAPIYHKSIAGKPFEEQLSMMRRWIMQDVGLNSDGTAKPCVVFYDYLKLMDTSGMTQDMKEYQVLGFMMTQLHNFATQFQIPIVAFVQLNRDGITKESTDTASGSDRIIWLCSNFTIFKRKSDEEITEDGPGNGNRKLLPLVSRHGGGLDDNDYINCSMKGWCAKITEGRTRLEVVNGINKDSNTFEDKTEDAIPFD